MVLKPLLGVRVLDLTQVLSGPFATQVLADLGAEVIKVEPPGGEKARKNGPLVEDASTYFASLNRGKASVVLDLKRPKGRGTFLALAAGSDVVVENFRPGVLNKLGIGYQDLQRVRPDIILASCSGFGQTGPLAARPALDIVVQAMAGTMSITGDGKGPMRSGFSVGDLGAGLYLAVGILAALANRQRSGKGARLDLSMLESQMALLENAFVRYLAAGEMPKAEATRHPVMAPFQAFRAQDGFLVIAVSTERHWSGLLAALGLPELKAEARFATAALRRQHVEDLEAKLAPRFREAPVSWWLDRLNAEEVPAGPVRSVAEAAAEPQVHDRGLFTEVSLGNTRFPVVGTPLRFEGDALELSHRVPLPGEDGPRVLHEILGYDAERIAALFKEGVMQ